MLVEYRVDPKKRISAIIVAKGQLTPFREEAIAIGTLAKVLFMVVHPVVRRGQSVIDGNAL